MTEGLPEAFLNRVRQQLGEELPDFLRSMEEPPVRGLRVNPLKPAGRNGCPGLSERIPWEENGWYLPEKATPGMTVWHEAGAFYLQDPAAMIPVRVLEPRPGENVLDLCAAPGGKSTQIAAAMHGEGILISNEPVPKRAQVLSRNLERMGVANAAAVCAMPDMLADRWPEAFDAVLVDAPCSGEGMFRREPSARTEWTAQQAAGCARRQRDILEAAARMVRPGGRMVYATCTFNPAENEDNVAGFLASHAEWKAEPFRLPAVDGGNGMFTCWLHRTRGEGQFAALLRKKGPGTAFLPEDRTIPEPDRDMKNMMHEQLPMLPEGTRMVGDTLVRIPFCPDVKGLRVYRIGLHLAQRRERRVVPDHAAAGFVTEGPFTDIPDDDALRYMAGETVSGTVKGWTVLRWRGMALGWGKGSDGVIRNHLPKGLRNARLTVSF